MPSLYRAVAIDYDGTLTGGQRPSPRVLAALGDARSQGLKLLLMTGRIIRELRLDFPDVDQWFDMIVAENGCVIARPGSGERVVAPAVDAALHAALLDLSIPVRCGQVLMATNGAYDREIMAEIRRLGLDCQLVRNRDALMILPAGTSKGTGLVEALGDLGISRHNTVGIGDAENDHSLVEACELGVAVGDAVDSLKRHADLVLKEPDGEGVAGFLNGPVLSGDVRIPSRRWKVDVGRRVDGQRATLPASRANLLVVGGSASGKSYLAGLIAERLVSQGYCLCIFDPEGDYEVLGDIRGVMPVRGGPDGIQPEELVRLQHHRFSSVVVDLSGLSTEQKQASYHQYMTALHGLRTEAGIPHWIMVDEADQLLAGAELSIPEAAPPQGFCLITYQPERLAPGIPHQIDVLLALRGGESFARTVWLDRAAPFGADPANGTAIPAELPPRNGLMVRREGVQQFVLGTRLSRHVRHWRKYLKERLPAHRRFYFRDLAGLTGSAAGNIEEFHDALVKAPAPVLVHHLNARDFSCWVADVIGDDTLAATMSAIELDWRNHSGGVELQRQRLLEAIEAAYEAESAPTR